MTDALAAFYEADVIVRSEGSDRFLVGIMVPWDTATAVDQTGRWATPHGTAWESFQRGALDKTLAESTRGIPLFGGTHPESSNRAKAAGVLHRSENLDDGQIAEWRLFRNYEGEEALQMAEARIWTGFSISYTGYGMRTAVGELAGRKHFLRQEVKLDHVAFIRNPSYSNAELLAVRAELEAADPGAAARARARIRRLSYLYR